MMTWEKEKVKEKEERRRGRKREQKLIRKGRIARREAG